MYAPERHREILDLTRKDGRVEVSGLAKALAVTPETVRRDLSVLERQGHLRRVHGGAILVDRLNYEPTITDREALLTAEKARVASAALLELSDASTIVLDSGTTTARLAEILPTDRALQVVTNSLTIASTLATRANISLHLVGGMVRGTTLAATGPWVEENLSQIRADVVFLGANGITPDHGFTTPDLNAAAAKRALMRTGRRVIVLADHTKVGCEDFARIADLTEVDLLITDDGIDPDLVQELEATGLAVLQA